MNALKPMVDYGVIGVLIALSLWAVAVERWFFYRRVKLTQVDNVQTMEIALTQRLVVIGTVTTDAPYIGLLGTVCARAYFIKAWTPAWFTERPNMEAHPAWVWSIA